MPYTIRLYDNKFNLLRYLTNTTAVVSFNCATTKVAETGGRRIGGLLLCRSRLRATSWKAMLIRSAI